jgi:peptidyl-prolyl cis-trans isomerase B (cyclophilin B)
VGGLAACSGGTDTTASKASPPPSAAGPSAVETTLPPPTQNAAPSDLRKVTCEYPKDTTGSPAKFVGYPPKRLSSSVIKATTMTIKTNRGDIVVDLDTKQTPCTVNSLAFLAKKNFFDNTLCFRLATLETNGLGLLQCGDPQAKGDGKNPSDGTGGPGYLSKDENTGGQYPRGTVFMAAPDTPDSNGSQFVISYTDENSGSLTVPYTHVGMVSKGLDIIDKIVKGGAIIFPDGGDITSDNGGANAPKMRVVIKDFVIS